MDDARGLALTAELEGADDSTTLVMTYADITISPCSLVKETGTYHLWRIVPTPAPIPNVDPNHDYDSHANQAARDYYTRRKNCSPHYYDRIRVHDTSRWECFGSSDELDYVVMRPAEADKRPGIFTSIYFARDDGSLRNALGEILENTPVETQRLQDLVSVAIPENSPGGRLPEQDRWLAEIWDQPAGIVYLKSFEECRERVSGELAAWPKKVKVSR